MTIFGLGRPCGERHVVKAMDDIRIERLSTACKEQAVWDLLALSVGFATAEKMDRVRRSYRDEVGRGLTVAWLGDRAIGVIGFARSDGELRLTHLAVVPDLHRAGVGRALVEAVAADHPNLAIVAETHDAAVAFYRRLGFAVELLRATAGRDPRWSCRREARETNGKI